MDKKNKIIVITGPSGSGKTEIYKKIKNLYNDKSNFSFKEELGAKLWNQEWYIKLNDVDKQTTHFTKTISDYKNLLKHIKNNFIKNEVIIWDSHIVQSLCFNEAKKEIDSTFKIKKSLILETKKLWSKICKYYYVILVILECSKKLNDRNRNWETKEFINFIEKYNKKVTKKGILKHNYHWDEIHVINYDYNKNFDKTISLIKNKIK